MVCADEEIHERRVRGESSGVDVDVDVDVEAACEGGLIDGGLGQERRKNDDRKLGHRSLAHFTSSVSVVTSMLIVWNGMDRGAILIQIRNSRHLILGRDDRPAIAIANADSSSSIRCLFIHLQVVHHMPHLKTTTTCYLSS